MWRTPGLRRFVSTVLGACAIAQALTVSLPHDHDASAASDQAKHCRLCKIQDGFAAAPVARAVPLALPAVEDNAPRFQAPAPRALVFLASGDSRAPPRLS